MNRAEKVWVNEKTNFFYIKRGIERTPTGSKVEVIKCNTGIQTTQGTLKGTVAYGLRNLKGQMIAYSHDTDDLILFAIEHDWKMDDPIFEQMMS
jgi:hypothetical protein